LIPLRALAGVARAPRRAGAWSRILVPAGVLALVAACDRLNDPTPVTIGDEAYTLRDLRRVLADIEPSKRPSLANREDRIAFVDRFIERRILAGEGERLLPEDPEARRDLERSREELLVDRLRVIEASREPVTPQDVEEAYERTAWVHRVERIVFLTREEAEKARARIAAGETFGVVARSGLGGRRLPAEDLSWNAYPDPVADEASRLEVGQLSEPVDSDGLWLLLRLVAREPREVPDLETSSTLLIRGLQLRREIEASRALGRQLREDAAVRIDDEAIRRIARRTREAILAEGVTEHDPNWALPALRADEEGEIVATSGFGVLWTAGDYHDTLRRVSRAQRPRSGPLETTVRRVVEAGVNRRLFVREAVRRGLDRDWWYLRSMGSIREDRLIRLAIERLESSVNADSARVDSLTSLLRDSQPGLFREERSARIARFDFLTREAALREREWIREAGGALARVGQILDGDPSFSGTYYLVYLSPGGVSNPGIERAVFEEGPGTLAGPFPMGEAWTVIECLEWIPEETLDESEIRERVAQQLARKNDPQVVADWVRKRRGELGVQVDVEALDELAPGR
jgi:hypothetical protein